MNAIDTLYVFLERELGLAGMSDLSITAIYRITAIFLTFLIIGLSFHFFKRCIKPIVTKLVAKTEVAWDDFLFSEQVLNATAHLLPPVVLYVFIPFIFYEIPGVEIRNQETFLESVFYSGTKIYMVVIIVRWCFVLLNSIRKVTDTFLDHRGGYMVGFIQVLKILVAFIAVIIIISILIDKSPLALFAGLGAAATVLMLVFKDALLGLVAGVQLSSNDMLRKGDWITMPQSGADGTVEEISLSTVKVRNFDNTITTIPPYTLISQSFQNWRGMQTSDGRRVRRALYLDVHSVLPCSEDCIQKLIHKGWLAEEQSENLVGEVNLILFRDAMEHYLRNCPQVNTEMKLMVRQLPYTPQGIPIEFYFFLKDKEWVTYEHNMHDILSRIISFMPDFGLCLYQSVSGIDLSNLMQQNTRV